MNVLIILGHPHSNSFNHAIADVCKTQLSENGHTAMFHDLYKEQFDPILGSSNPAEDNDIKQHSSDLVNSDGIIVIHPNWWGQPPAIVKGWLDRVLMPEVAYRIEKDAEGKYHSKGLLKAQSAIVINTSNTPDELEEELFKDPLETIWKNRVFKFCGVTNFKRINFRVIKDSNHNQRTIWLSEIREVIDKSFPKQ
ncbi:MAG: NAD(P)H-dependent oxidoreductase [Bacteroidales bacterium]|nr:NAD(P)H-dependent oxidoreductase [Bacteroidales bacterium]